MSHTLVHNQKMLFIRGICFERPITFQVIIGSVSSLIFRLMKIWLIPERIPNHYFCNRECQIIMTEAFLIDVSTIELGFSYLYISFLFVFSA